MFIDTLKAFNDFKNKQNKWSVLINQFVPPTLCLCFAFTGINFRGMLHPVCDAPMTTKCVDQSELVSEGVQID